MELLKFAAMFFVLSAVIMMLGGCAAGPTKIPPPSGRLLAEPAKFPHVGPNDDVRKKFVEAALVHAKNAERLRDLQEWARAASD